MASGRVAREAAVYPFEVCKAILEGCLQQLQKDGRTSEHLHGIQESWEPEDLLCSEVDEQCQINENQARLRENFMKIAEMSGLQPTSIKTAYAREAATLRMTTKRSLGRPSRSEAQRNLPGFIGALGPKVYRDAMTGQALDEALVRAAQSLELDYFKGKDVWVKVLRSEAMAQTGKRPIPVKWIITNKGDDMDPNYRARLVAMEIRRAGEDPIFAPTPPLESLRTVLSLAATDMPGQERKCRDPENSARIHVSFIDICRAYFCAATDPDSPTYVELPAEDPDQIGRASCRERV